MPAVLHSRHHLSHTHEQALSHPHEGERESKKEKERERERLFTLSVALRVSLLLLVLFLVFSLVRHQPSTHSLREQTDGNNNGNGNRQQRESVRESVHTGTHTANTHTAVSDERDGDRDGDRERDRERERVQRVSERLPLPFDDVSITLSHNWLLRQTRSQPNTHSHTQPSTPSPFLTYHTHNSIPYPVSEDFPPFSVHTGVNLWDLFPPTVACPDSVRLGRVGEGGKWICGLSFLQRERARAEYLRAQAHTQTHTGTQRQLSGALTVDNATRTSTDTHTQRHMRTQPAQPSAHTSTQTHTLAQKECVMYSFGISTDITFELELLSRTNCRIFAFDPTVGSLPLSALPRTLSSVLSLQEIQERIVFHKIALSSSSGSDEIHAMTESFQDIMHRLGHDHVDIVKMDIESGEWLVFRDIRERMGQNSTESSGDFEQKTSISSFFSLSRSLNEPSSSRATRNLFPVGQLLIELHYSTLTDAMEFFSAARTQWGLHVFSREINLQPALAGGAPVACEYSLINPELFFLDRDPDSEIDHHIQSEHVKNKGNDKVGRYNGWNEEKELARNKEIAERNKSLSLSVPPPQHAEQHTRIHALIYFLSHAKNIERLRKALVSLYMQFWRFYPHYRVLIFHDDFTAEQRALLQRGVPHMPLFFEELEFPLPRHLLAPRNVSSTTEGAPHSLAEALGSHTSSHNTSLSHNARFQAIVNNLHNKSYFDGDNVKIEVPSRTVCDPAHSSLGYRHMCRFHAFFVYDVLHERGYLDDKLEYILRLDDDSSFSTPIGYDIFRYMRVNRKKYGYVNAVFDDALCVRDLWESVRELADRFTHNVTQEEWARCASTHCDDDKRTQAHAHTNTHSPSSTTMNTLPRNPHNFLSHVPQGFTFYNNFEVSHVSVWRHALTQRISQALDALGGIYSLRWGDAPIHTLLVSLLLSREEVHAFDDISYRHMPFVDQSSKGLAPRTLDAFAKQFLDCRYYDRWQCHVLSNRLVHWDNGLTNASFNASFALFNVTYNTSSLRGTGDIGSHLQQQHALSHTGAGTVVEAAEVLAAQILDSQLPLTMNALREPLKPPTTAERQQLLQYDALLRFSLSFSPALTRLAYSTHPPLSQQALSVAQTHGERGRGVLYTFAHRGREVQLLRTLRSLHEHCARSHNAPFVVFYSDVEGAFNVNYLHRMLSDVNRNLTQPIAVSLLAVRLPLREQSLERDEYCDVPDDEVWGAMQFMRFRALAVLSAMGFEWFVRIGDDARLHKTIEDPLFARLERGGQRFAYISALPGREECLRSLWSLGDSLCALLDEEKSRLRQQGKSEAYISSVLPHCGSAYRQSLWKRGTVAVTNLAATHLSLLQHPLAVLLFTALGEFDPSVLLSNTQDSQAMNITFLTQGSDAKSQAASASASASFLQYPDKSRKSHVFDNHYAFNRQIVTSSVFVDLLQRVKRVPRSASLRWSEAAVHTLAHLLSLSEEAQLVQQVAKLTDLHYQFHWYTGAESKLQDKKLDALGRFRTYALSNVEAALGVRPIGWLGGDIATSVPIASHNAGAGERVDRAVWLFGDSLLGVSTRTQRERALTQVVANTVAVMTLRPSNTLSATQTQARTSCHNSSLREIESVRFHWRESEILTDKHTDANSDTDTHVAVEPIFSLTQSQRARTCGGNTPSAVWPVAGIAVGTSLSHTDTNTDAQASTLLVAAQIVCLGVSDVKQDKVENLMKSLDFAERGTLLVRVHNPLSQPQEWTYSSDIVPQPCWGELKW